MWRSTSLRPGSRSCRRRSPSPRAPPVCQLQLQRVWFFCLEDCCAPAFTAPTGLVHNPPPQGTSFCSLSTADNCLFWLFNNLHHLVVWVVIGGRGWDKLQTAFSRIFLHFPHFYAFFCISPHFFHIWPKKIPWAAIQTYWLVSGFLVYFFLGTRGI